MTMKTISQHSFKEWLIALRPWSFPASVMPVMVTLLYLYWQGEVMDWVAGLWALVEMMLFHAAGNTWSDYFDYQRGVDVVDTPGASVLTNGLFLPGEVMRLSLWLSALALLGALGLLLYMTWPFLALGVEGLPMVWQTLRPLLAVGLIGVACSLLYPTLKYRAFGDLVIFMDFALLPTLGTAYVASGHWCWTALWLALPLGLITVAILHANNTRDIETDGQAGITTLPMRLGGRMSAWVYRAEVLFPFFWLLLCVWGGVLPVWSLLSCLALVPALANCRLAGKWWSGEAIALDLRTAQLQLAFSLLLGLSFLLGGLLK